MRRMGTFEVFKVFRMLKSFELLRASVLWGSDCHAGRRAFRTAGRGLACHLEQREQIERLARHRRRAARGMTLIEVLIAALILGVVTVIFGTALPMASLTSAVVSEDTFATTVARQKMEQIKGLRFENLDYERLLDRNVIDSAPQDAPYGFTNIDNLQQALRDAQGEIDIQAIETGVKQIRVTILWTDARANPRSVSLVSQTTEQ